MITLDKEDYIKLVNGEFKSFQCTHCDGRGWYFVHEDGFIGTPKSDDDSDLYYRHNCEHCDGTGFNVVFDE